MSEQVEVLLVDDSQSDVKLTLHAIQAQSLPHRFKVLRDGEQVLQFLGSGPVPLLRLILLDLKLPKVNGFAVLKAIKSDPRTRLVPVVILTSSSQERDIRMSYQLGANSYVQKPVDFDTFCAVIQGIRAYWLGTNKIPSGGRGGFEELNGVVT